MCLRLYVVRIIEKWNTIEAREGQRPIHQSFGICKSSKLTVISFHWLVSNRLFSKHEKLHSHQTTSMALVNCTFSLMRIVSCRKWTINKNNCITRILVKTSKIIASTVVCLCTWKLLNLLFLKYCSQLNLISIPDLPFVTGI